MKKNFLQAITTIIYSLLLIHNANAQQKRLECGPNTLDSLANTRAVLYAQTNNPQAIPATLIRVFFHVLADDNGTNATLTPAQIETEFTALVNAYSPANICFVKMGQEFINNTNFNNNINGDGGSGAGIPLLPYNYSGTINIWYMKTILGSNAACGCGYGGITFGIPNNYCLIASSNIGDNNTIAHEMGHALGLSHTFDTSHSGSFGGPENINGSNSSTAGDKVPDTPADPYAYLGQSCFSSSGCNYTGTCTDPNGQTNFSPPYTNRMSYWRCTPFNFTNGQFARVNSFLGSTQILKDCTSPSSFTVTPGTYGAFYFKSAINSLSTTFGINTVTIGGIVKASLGAAHVFLEPGFHASPVLNTSFVRIESSPCY